MVPLDRSKFQFIAEQVPIEYRLAFIGDHGSPDCPEAGSAGISENASLPFDPLNDEGP